MTPLATRGNGVSGRPRTLTAALGITFAGILAIVLAACSGNAQQTNAYTDALNSVQVKINSVVSATATPEAYQAAVAQNMPTIKSDLQQLQAAQGNLTGQTQTIAQKCTTDVQQIVSGLESINAALTAKDSKAVETARQTTNTEIQSLKSCIDEWNTNNGNSGK